MAKLYWRVKRDGKWTWSPVRSHPKGTMDEVIQELLEYDQILPPVEESE